MCSALEIPTYAQDMERLFWPALMVWGPLLFALHPGNAAYVGYTCMGTYFLLVHATPTESPVHHSILA